MPTLKANSLAGAGPLSMLTLISYVEPRFRLQGSAVHGLMSMKATDAASVVSPSEKKGKKRYKNNSKSNQKFCHTPTAHKAPG